MPQAEGRKRPGGASARRHPAAAHVPRLRPEETPGPGYLTNSSGAGPSTGCACRPACSYERVSTRSCDQVAVQVSLKCSILVRQLTYTLMWSSRSTGVAEVLPSGSDAPGWW